MQQHNRPGPGRSFTSRIHEGGQLLITLQQASRHPLMLWLSGGGACQRQGVQADRTRNELRAASEIAAWRTSADRFRRLTPAHASGTPGRPPGGHRRHQP